MIIELEEKYFEMETKDLHNRAAVIFFGQDWCAHCKHFAPEFATTAYMASQTTKLHELDPIFYKFYP